MSAILFESLGTVDIVSKLQGNWPTCVATCVEWGDSAIFVYCSTGL